MEERVSNLVDDALKKLGIRGAVRSVRASDTFAEIVGAAIAPHCKAVNLERGVLMIATDNSALAHQLQLESARIIESMNEKLGGEVVKKFRFTTMDSTQS